uniref:CPG4 domain-containing protein n=1 Tax=Elaeophora elaphi TaxID=1147741 RepID=A0A0R3S6M6_9BILA
MITVTATRKSGINGTTILTDDDVRTCSCDEQHTCIREMKSQAANCISPCLYKFQQITNQIEDLKACFQQKQQVMIAFFSCFENNINSCVNTKTGPRIPKTNITELLRVIALSITKNVRNMANVITSSINPIIDTAGEFAICVKDCFLDKNHDGFCFDRSDCQPSLLVAKAKRTLKRCSHSINWKKELGEFCKCAVDAGLA